MSVHGTKNGTLPQDKHDIKYELQIAQYAEEKGFFEIWQAGHETGARLHRYDERTTDAHIPNKDR